MQQVATTSAPDFTAKFQTSRVPEGRAQINASTAKTLNNMAVVHDSKGNYDESPTYVPCSLFSSHLPNRAVLLPPTTLQLATPPP